MNAALIKAHNDALTLFDLLWDNTEVLHNCRDCGSSRELELGSLIARFGGETRVAYLERNLTCKKCAH